MSVFFIIIQLHEVEYNGCANQEQIYTGFFKYKITICPNLALYFAENEELSFNRQFNALYFILGEKDEFIITKAKRGGKESFSFFV